MQITGYRNHNERVRDQEGRSLVETAKASADSVKLLQSIEKKLHQSNLLAIAANDMFTDEQRQQAVDTINAEMFRTRGR